MRYNKGDKINIENLPPRVSVVTSKGEYLKSIYRATAAALINGGHGIEWIIIL